MTPEFGYLEGELHVEAVPVAAIAEAVGTPAYIYSGGGHAGAVAGAADGVRRPVDPGLLRDQGEQQSGRDQDAGGEPVLARRSCPAASCSAR